MVRGSGVSLIDPGTMDPFAWYDPSDLTTLFQTNDTSTPVTADGQTVGRISDKSGNGHHLTQSTAGARPTYNKTSGGLSWLEFDGIDDFVARATPTLSQPWEAVSGIRQLAWTSSCVIFGRGSALTDAGFLFQSGSSPSLALYDGNGDINVINGGAAIDADVVAIERHNGAGSRLGFDAGTYISGDSGNGSVDGLSIGAKEDGTVAANFRFYGRLVFDRLLTDTEIAQLRAYLAAKQGRVL